MDSVPWSKCIYIHTHTYIQTYIYIYIYTYISDKLASSIIRIYPADCHRRAPVIRYAIFWVFTQRRMVVYAA